MGECDERRRRGWRRRYQDYLTEDPGRRRLSPLRWLRERRKRRRLVSTPLPGGDGRWSGGGPDDDGDTGGAGVREPRRPLPRAPQGAAELPRD